MHNRVDLIPEMPQLPCLYFSFFISLFQPLNQVLRRFCIALAGVEPVCAGAAGMTVDLDEPAVFFAGQPGGVFFHLAADASAAVGGVDGEVADASEVAGKGDLG